MSSVASSALEIAGRVGLQPPTLDTPIKECAFLSLASFVDPWRLVFFELLAPTDISDVDAENVGRSEQEKRVACLRKWKSRYGAEASYRVIVQSALKCGRVDNAEGICRQLLQESQSQAVVRAPHADTCDSSTESSENKQETTSSPKSDDSSLECQNKIQVGERISKLEEWFSDLKGKLLSEMNANQTISPQTILGSLAMLPMSLQAEYKKYVMENLSTLAAANSVTVMFVHLSFNFTFIDHGLLEHLIKKFGSDHLKQDMSSYAAEIQVFLDETTVAQLGDYWPGRQELPPHFDKLLVMINKNPGKYSLRMVNNLRKRFCSEMHLSEVVFVLIGIGKANSFIIVFMVPSVLGPRLVESVGGVDDSFYQRECIISISLNQQQLYLSIALREKKAECESRLLALCRGDTGDIQEFIYILSQLGVDPNIFDQDGWTPLGLTCYHGRSDVADVLINYGTKVDLPYNNDIGDSPLITASVRGHVALCKLLIERGATVDNQTKDGCTALYTASQRGQKEVVELLLNSSASVDKPNMDNDSTALRVASVNGQTEVVRVLIARGASLDYQDEEGGTPLYMATQKGHTEVAKLLLHSGAQPDIPTNKDSSTPLTMATNAGNEDIAKLLIHHGAAVNYQDEDGWSPLHFASAYGHPSLVELLVKSRAELDIQTKGGMTALAWAAYQGHKQIVNILLNARANPDIQDQGGHTALAWAAYEGDKKIVNILLNAGAMPDIQNQEGLTALMLATQRGQKDAVKILLEKKANPNIADVTAGWTALHFAAKEDHIEISQMLIKGGADVEIKDKNEATPFHLAKIQGNQDICDLLNNFYNSQTEKEVTQEQREQVKKSYQRLLSILDVLEDKLLPGRAEKKRKQKQSKERAANITDSLSDTVVQD